MRLPTRPLFTLIFLILGVSKVIAQYGWQPWEPLYKDNFIEVEVKFYIPVKNNCQSNGKFFKYQYQVKGNYRRSPYYLNWSMAYGNCKGELVHQSNSLEIGKHNPTDISSWTSIQSMEYKFLAVELEDNQFDVTTGRREKVGVVSRTRKLSLAPVKIEGMDVVHFTKELELKIVGGKLGVEAEWVWYEDRCGGKTIGKGRSIKKRFSQNVQVYVRAEGKHNVTKCIKKKISVKKNSIAPLAINGQNKLCRGENQALSVSGGALGQQAQWVWYQDNCGGSPIGTGPSVNINPKQSSSYYVRAEGGGATTNCASISVKVVGPSITPQSIQASSTSICEGKELQLQLIGGQLADDAVWKWYQSGCGSGEVGRGQSIKLRPKISTTYYVRAEGVCNNTKCISISINVQAQIASPKGIDRPTKVYQGQRVKLKVNSTQVLPAGSQWQWYKNNCGGSIIGRGTTITVKAKQDTRYYVQARGQCNETICAQTYLQPIPRQEEKYYSSTQKIIHYGWGGGIDWIYFRDTALYKLNTDFDSLVIPIQGLGPSAEIVFHPILKENFSLGISASGAVGVSPKIFEGGASTSLSGRTAKENYLFAQWELGGEATLGLRPIKLLAIYKKRSSYHDYRSVADEESVNEERLTFRKNYHQEIVGLGIRIGRYTSKYIGNRKNLDLLYTFSQDTPQQFFAFDPNRLTIARHGISMVWWRHNKWRIKCDYTFLDQRKETFNFENQAFQISLLIVSNRFF